MNYSSNNFIEEVINKLIKKKVSIEEYFKYQLIY